MSQRVSKKKMGAIDQRLTHKQTIIFKLQSQVFRVCQWGSWFATHWRNHWPGETIGWSQNEATTEQSRTIRWNKENVSTHKKQMDSEWHQFLFVNKLGLSDVMIFTFFQIQEAVTRGTILSGCEKRCKIGTRERPGTEREGDWPEEKDLLPQSWALESPKWSKKASNQHQASWGKGRETAKIMGKENGIHKVVFFTCQCFPHGRWWWFRSLCSTRCCWEAAQPKLKAFQMHQVFNDIDLLSNVRCRQSWMQTFVCTVIVSIPNLFRYHCIVYVYDVYVTKRSVWYVPWESLPSDSHFISCFVYHVLIDFSELVSQCVGTWFNFLTKGVSLCKFHKNKKKIKKKRTKTKKIVNFVYIKK